MENNPNYKRLYRDLAQTLYNLNCYVCDFDVLGHVTHSEVTKAFIHIEPKMNYKGKLFVLAHEAGHIFYMKKGKAFNWAKKMRTEKQANFFAVQLLRMLKVDVSEYYLHYNKAKKRKKRKSWIEL